MVELMGSFEGAEVALVDAWVEQRLAAYTAELEQEANGLASKVFPYYAPPGTPYPFVIYQCQSDPRDIRGVGVARIFVDTLYVVKAVAQTKTWDDLKGIAHIIDKAMTSPEGSAVEDGTVFTSVRDEGFHLIEVDQGNQFRHLGGQYKIQAQG